MRSSTLLALLPLAMAAPPAKRDSPAPLLAPRGAQLITDKWIVKIRGDAATTATESAISSIAADADYVYKTNFRGFASTLTAEELKKLQNDPNVSLGAMNYYRSIQVDKHTRSNTLSRMPSSRRMPRKMAHRGVLLACPTLSQAATPTPMTTLPAKAHAPTSLTRALTSSTPSSVAVPSGWRTSLTTTTPMARATEPTSPVPSAPRPTVSPRRPSSLPSRSLTPMARVPSKYYRNRSGM
jgi:hypothetical protein